MIISLAEDRIGEIWMYHHRIFLHEVRTMDKDSFSSKISFLRPGWWIIHLMGITVIYTLGHILWR
jgi:hypothetical protein